MGYTLRASFVGLVYVDALNGAAESVRRLVGRWRAADCVIKDEDAGSAGAVMEVKLSVSAPYFLWTTTRDERMKIASAGT